MVDAIQSARATCTPCHVGGITVGGAMMCMPLRALDLRVGPPCYLHTVLAALKRAAL